MEITLPYGAGVCTARLENGLCLGVLDVADAPGLARLPEAAAEALEHPIGLSGSVWDALRPGETVAILVSDAFRKTGVEQLLPTLLEGLNRGGIPDEHIRFVFATGTHRAPTPEEQARILGPAVFARFQDRAFAHDPDDAENLTPVGITSRGTRVWVNKRARDCDRVIATGSVVLHYFGGFGGGRKSVLPGIAARESIAQNHSLNLHPERDALNPAVRIAALDGNPVAEDMLEGARLCGVDFIVNTVLNRRNEIAGIFAGELDAAHRVACRFAQDLFAVPIERRADLVIASAGGAKNFIQSHKALFNAYQAMKPGGRMVFACPAPEGYGGNKFAEWLALGTPQAIIAALRRQAEINGQTALSTLEKAPHCVFYTGLSPVETARLGARYAGSLQEAVELACTELRAQGTGEPGYYLMPTASYTVPVLHEKTSG